MKFDTRLATFSTFGVQFGYKFTIVIENQPVTIEGSVCNICMGE